MSKKPPGLRPRHARSCPAGSNRDARCRCDPSYEAWVFDPKAGKAGKKIRRTFAGKGARAAAIGWRQDAAGDVRRGKLRAVQPIALSEVVDRFVAGMKDGTIRTRAGDRYRASTTRSYEQALRDHVVPKLGTRKLAKITTPELQDFVDELVAENTNASTIQNTLNPLRRIYARAMQRGEVAVNPTLGLATPAVRSRRERIASPSEARTLLSVLLPADRIVYALGFYAGLRLGEIQALDWANVDLAAGQLRVDAEKGSYDQKAGTFGPPKTRAGERTVPIAGVLRDELTAWAARQGEREGLVCGRPDGRFPFASAVERRAKVRWKQATPEPLAPITLHETRHTFASLLIEADLNPKKVATYMGHADVATTLNVYSKLFEDHAQDSLQKLDDLLARHDTAARIAQVEGGDTAHPDAS